MCAVLMLHLTWLSALHSCPPSLVASRMARSHRLSIRTPPGAITRWNSAVVNSIRLVSHPCSIRECMLSDLLVQGMMRRHVVALLYPVGGGRTRLVRLPADSPFTEEPGSHIWPEDLCTKRWHSRGSQRTRISTLPDDLTFALANHYSIITSRCSATASVNRSIYNTWGIVVRGHVIVIRHAVRNRMRVTNVLHAERRFIDVLVRR